MSPVSLSNALKPLLAISPSALESRLGDLKQYPSGIPLILSDSGFIETTTPPDDPSRLDPVIIVRPGSDAGEPAPTISLYGGRKAREEEVPFVAWIRSSDASFKEGEKTALEVVSPVATTPPANPQEAVVGIPTTPAIEAAPPGQPEKPHLGRLATPPLSETPGILTWTPAPPEKPGYGNTPKTAYVPMISDGQLGEIGRREVTLHMEKADPQKALFTLLRAADASYVISGEENAGRPVSFNFKKVTLENALSAIAGAAGLSYGIRGNVIILSPKMNLMENPLQLSSMFGYEGKLKRVWPDGRMEFESDLTKPVFRSQPKIDPNQRWHSDHPYIATFDLKSWTVEDVFATLKLLNDQDVPKDELQWSYFFPGKGVPNGIDRVEGEKGSHTLRVTGDPGAIKRFSQRIERLVSKSRNENE